MSPCFSFFIPGEEGRIAPGSLLWDLPLSGNSSDFLKKTPGNAKGSDINIGEYFTAAKTFLEGSEDPACPILGSAFFAMMDKDGKEDPLLSADLFLEKHGAFYHPLRVRVLSETGRSASFVLNGAVSRPGLDLIQKEYQLLAGLENQVSVSYTPRVFKAGTVILEKKEVGFFLGEWFEGFQEFHISEVRGGQQIAVWDSDGSLFYLTLDKAFPIYEQIAYILTTYYNLDTGEQIFPWHHAAGDFVVNPHIPGLPVKLITVRGYGPLTDFSTDGTGVHLLPLLLFFFLNLTLRMQLDRLDGIGNMIFLGDRVLRATIKGFFRALDDKKDLPPGKNSGPGSGERQLKKAFINFVAGFSREQILEVLENLMESWGSDSHERAIIEAHLESHCDSVHSLFKNM